MKNVIIAYQNHKEDSIINCKNYSQINGHTVINVVPISEALKHCILDKVDTIIINSLTELMFLYPFEKTINEFESNGVKIKCLKEGIELFDGSPASMIFLHSIFYVMESHRTMISQRIKRGIQARKNKLLSEISTKPVNI